MNAQQNQVTEDVEKLKEIPKWTRKYAQNRTIPVLIALAINLCQCAGIAIPSYLGAKAYMSGNLVLFWICIFVLAVAMIYLVFFCVPKWGGKFIERISRRLYKREGNVLVSVPETIKKKLWVGYVVAMVFVSCVSILYLWQRPIISPLALLWPTLYAIHAILVVAGVPIQFGGFFVFLNMLIPIAGYGILSGLIGHVYSRYALKKLKTTAHIEENNND
jgi:hypothetical protein